MACRNPGPVFVALPVSLGVCPVSAASLSRTRTSLPFAQGTIFNKLSELVAEQGELAIRIDDNVDTSLSNVNAAQVRCIPKGHGTRPTAKLCR